MIMAAAARMSEHSRVFTIYIDPADGDLDKERLDNTVIIVGGSITSTQGRRSEAAPPKGAGLKHRAGGF